MKVRTLYDRILVTRLDPKQQAKGGIIIPDTAKEKGMEGKVVAVGAGRVTKAGKRIPLEVKVGDKVLIGKYSGQEVKIDDVEYMVLKESDVMGIIS
jgi:chaperonin GroES